MPIYAYKCESCGFAKDVLQKIADAPLEVCPACSQLAFRKQLTAAGFQLKGSGWYVTDFRGGNNAAGSTSTSQSGDVAKPSGPAETSAATPAPAATSTTSSES